MEIILYYNNSEKIKLDKDLTQIGSIEGRLFQDTSITKPSIMFDLDTAVFSANYLYIPQFNRYYFITDVVNISANKWQIQARVDVLTSFKSAIRQNTAIIERQENEYNLYLDDKYYRAYQNEDVQYKKFSASLPGDKYILVVNGGGMGIVS